MKVMCRIPPVRFASRTSRTTCSTGRFRYDWPKNAVTEQKSHEKGQPRVACTGRHAPNRSPSKRSYRGSGRESMGGRVSIR